MNLNLFNSVLAKFELIMKSKSNYKCSQCQLRNICKLYYKHITIVNDDSSIINKWQVALTDDTKVIICDCNMFTIHKHKHW